MRGPGICILKAVHPSGETSGLATAAKGEKGKLPAAEMVTISWKWREVAGRGGGETFKPWEDTAPRRVRVFLGLPGSSWGEAGRRLGTALGRAGKVKCRRRGSMQREGTRCAWAGRRPRRRRGAGAAHTAGLAETSALAVSRDRSAKNRRLFLENTIRKTLPLRVNG